MTSGGEQIGGDTGTIGRTNRTTRLQPLFLANVRVGPASAPTNLIQNSGFESGDFTGWRQSGDTSFTFVNAAKPVVHSGRHAAFLGPSEQGVLEQDFAAEPNAVLAISFWLSNFAQSRNVFSMALNGTEMFCVRNAKAFGYTPYRFLATGTLCGRNTLSFAVQHCRSYFALDSVFVIAADMPAPSSVPPLRVGGWEPASVRHLVAESGFT